MKNLLFPAAFTLLLTIGFSINFTHASDAQAESKVEATTTSSAETDVAPPIGAAEQPFKVVCFGDSITGHRPHTEYQKHYLKYTDMLQLMLEARLGIGNVIVENAGWAGDATYPKPSEKWPGGVKRLQKDLIDRKPDLAIVLIGGNDKLKDDASRTRTQTNLKTIAKSLKDAGIPTLMLQYHEAMPAAKNKDKGWYHLNDKNELIAAAAKAHGHPTVSLEPAMTAAAKRYGEGYLVDAKDGVHLKPAGERTVARVIFHKLDQLGWITPKKTATTSTDCCSTKS